MALFKPTVDRPMNCLQPSRWIARGLSARTIATASGHFNDAGAAGIPSSKSTLLKISRGMLKVWSGILLIGFCWLPTSATAQSPIPIPNDTVIVMQRGNCEVMACPIYRVLIFADGDVIWQGHGRVAKLGLAPGRIERDRIRALIQEFEAIDYFHLENIYGFRGGGCQSS